jgi:hypothetical protein
MPFENKKVCKAYLVLLTYKYLRVYVPATLRYSELNLDSKEVFQYVKESTRSCQSVYLWRRGSYHARHMFLMCKVAINKCIAGLLVTKGTQGPHINKALQSLHDRSVWSGWSLHISLSLSLSTCKDSGGFLIDADETPTWPACIEINI